MRARTGAGKRGLSSEPSGALMRMARRAPSLNGTSAPVRIPLRQPSVDETVEAKGALSAVATCGDVPA